jgi:polyphosphate kinase
MSEIRIAPRSSGANILEQAAEAASPGKVEMGEGWMLNMELSNLAFQRRVVDLADDPQVPLLERVRFLSILGSNLDEFFMTRVAGFQRQIALGNTKRTLDGMSPDEQLRVIGVAARDLLDRVYQRTIPALMAELATHDIQILRWQSLSSADRRYIRTNYTAQLDSIVSPLLMMEDGTFPHIRNLRPALIVVLGGGGPEKYATIELPGDIPRLVPLPGGRRFVPLEDVIEGSLARLLDERQIDGCYLFRVTRSGNLNLDSDNLDDLVEAVAETVARRPFQPAVRLEIDGSTPPDIADFLLKQLQEEAETRMSHLDESCY